MGRWRRCGAGRHPAAQEVAPTGISPRCLLAVRETFAAFPDTCPRSWLQDRSAPSDVRPCPRIAPTLPSIEVEVEAEAATRELGGAAPITRRATNQARAPYGRRAPPPTRRGMDPSETNTCMLGGKRKISLRVQCRFSCCPGLGVASFAGYAVRRYGASARLGTRTPRPVYE